jgi:hypothetical protein
MEQNANKRMKNVKEGLGRKKGTESREPGRKQ